MFSSKQIRKMFLDYFAERGHKVVKSSPLIPGDDPTLLFTNAGMNQFKDYFTGARPAPFPRACSVQKCVRAGGKHNDLENVGRTARHHTFFEMLGNFSFGDYFKREACQFAWEFVTEHLNLPAEKIWVTVFEEDDEAFIIWRDLIGVPEKRIVRMGEKDNFWAMGDTGPCGPCSELLFDQGEGPGGIWKDDDIYSDSDRYLEIWNLVFMQYERLSDGRMLELPKPSIDTGAGLERMTAISQGVYSNYDTDLFLPIIHHTAAIAGVKYGDSEDSDVSLRVIADHARAATFLIADHVFPSNDGRGYVLRRIMRRAIRHGKRLGIDSLFFASVCKKVIEEMSDIYPELAENENSILSWAETEESSFRQTLNRGLKTLADEIDRIKSEGGDKLSGKFVFTLYDQDGFPPDLTALIAEEQGVGVDMEGFEKEMEKQRQRGKASWKESDSSLDELFATIRQEHGPTRFVGYERIQDKGSVIALIKSEDGKHRLVDSASAGDEVLLISDSTPFYGESGGQVGDVGVASSDSAELEITDTQKPMLDFIVHNARILKGSVAVGDELSFQVDEPRRKAIMRHHSATHLLHYALRKVLGSHVKQSGSYVAPDRLRFDFSHFKAVSRTELLEVERIVNQLVMENFEVITEVTTPDEARQKGALMFFGEKYGEKVRMLTMGPSKELCGGTHVGRTGDIGYFRIVSEGAIASGVRRIEAIAGAVAVEEAQAEHVALADSAALLHVAGSKLPSRIEDLLRELKDAEKRIKELETELAKASLGDVESKVVDTGKVRVLAQQVEADDMQALRELAFELRDRIGPKAAVVLAAVSGKKVNLSIALGEDAIAAGFSAGEAMKQLAPIVGGKGGGKKENAQGGGGKIEAVDEFLSAAVELFGKN